MLKRQSCFNAQHHRPHTREELREDVFAFVAELADATGVDIDPQKVWDELQPKIRISEEADHA